VGRFLKTNTDCPHKHWIEDFFSDETAVFKVFYLRIKELYQKWQGHSIRNWVMVMNRLIIDERIGAMVQKYQGSV